MTDPALMIDTHCHLNFQQYAGDQAEVIRRAAQAGVTRIIIPGVDENACREALALAGQHPGIYAAIGIHPNSAKDFSQRALDVMQELARNPGVVAIGEIGLDYYWDKSPKEKQQEAFEALLELAAELELPVIIHNREASEDVIRILESRVNTLTASLKERPGVLHSFSASMAIAERALAIGFYLGFTGPITFKKADDLRNVARNTPMDRILVETDGPFLTPAPHRGKRNEPAYIPFIVDALAGLKGMSAEEMAQITTRNAEGLFRLPEIS